jgi:methyl-accepting chemotaxis protein
MRWGEPEASVTPDEFAPPFGWREAAAAEIRAEFIAKMGEVFDLLEVDVKRLIDGVVKTTATTQKDVEAFADALQNIRTSSEVLTRSVDHAAHDASKLAFTTTALTSSGDEINSRLREASALAHDATVTTEQARTGAT